MSKMELGRAESNYIFDGKTHHSWREAAISGMVITDRASKIQIPAQPMASFLFDRPKKF